MTLLEGLEQELRKACPGLELRKNEPMAKHTSFRVGGPAALMALPGEDEVRAVLEAAFRCNVTPFFLGNGSNLLVSDAGYDGFVVKLAGRCREGEVSGTDLLAGGAMPLSAAAQLALDHGLSGLEWAAGIPGTVGGAVTMNAGAYGGEVSQVLRQVQVLDCDGRVEVVSRENCGFSYRKSAFSDGKRLILEALFALTPGDSAAIREKMADLAARRKEKQPLEYPSAGSTFKRPPPVDGKPVYAAELIDRCGLKGLTIGGAQVSEKHAGFLINRAGATCGDLLALMEEVKRRVYDQTGVLLEPEVKTLGV